MTRMRRIVGQRVRRMTAEQAGEWLIRYNENWVKHKSIISQPIKELTNGLNSQSINAYVVRKVYDRSKTGK